MHEAALVIARPQGAKQLVLLFHGVGSSAANLAPLGRAQNGLRFHLVHGQQDAVVPAAASVAAARELQALGGQVTLDLVPGLGHGIDARALAQAIAYLD